MKSVLEVLIYLAAIQELRKKLTTISGMRQHTFITTINKKTDRQIFNLPNNISDAAIKGVINWQKNKLKQN